MQNWKDKFIIMKKINSLGIKLSFSFVDEFVWNLRDKFKHRVVQALCRSEKMRLHVFYSMTVQIQWTQRTIVLKSEQHTSPVAVSKTLLYNWSSWRRIEARTLLMILTIFSTPLKKSLMEVRGFYLN